MRRRGPGPTSIETAIWRYWAATAGCALAAVWAGMGLQHVLLDAESIAFVDTVLDIGTPGTSGTRTALTLAAFTIVFAVLSADLFWGATRTLLEPLDIIRGRVSVSALINAETSPKPSGEAPVELDVRIARWDRAMITSNVIYVLGGLLLGYSAYVALMPG